MIRFCADNCNTNFGGVNRRGHNNVFYKVKDNIKRDLVGIGCTIHIVHNCIQHAVDTLPVCVNSLVLKIYKFFHIYTVRVSELKEVCNFANVEYQRLLQHGNTRFLSLLPALERVFELFEALKSYFNSQEHCPTIIRQCFENPTQELYLWFVYGQLKYFNERQKTIAVDVAIILTELKLNLHEKRVNNFVPHQAKCILEKLEKDGEVSAKFFLNQTTCFYEKCESYQDVYRRAYESVTPNLWPHSSENLSWQPVCASAEKINSMFAKQIIDIDALFNEHVLVKNYNFASDRKERWKNTTISYEQKRTQLLQAFKDKDIPISNFQKLVKFVFCLPGTSASVERIFSIMKNMRSDDRSSMRKKMSKLSSCAKVTLI